jgi:hypothetical protein
MDSQFWDIYRDIRSLKPATSCSSRLANDSLRRPERSFSTWASLSFALSMRVDDPTLAIVAIRRRLVSFSGTIVSMTLQRPLNSSISATSLSISGVIVMCLISCMTNIHSYPFPPISPKWRQPLSPIRKSYERGCQEKNSALLPCKGKLSHLHPARRCWLAAYFLSVTQSVAGYISWVSCRDGGSTPSAREAAAWSNCWLRITCQP